jgi:hypothetical protein
MCVEERHKRKGRVRGGGQFPPEKGRERSVLHTAYIVTTNPVHVMYTGI